MHGYERIRWNQQNYLYVGVTDAKLRKQLLEVEADFIGGKPISVPFRPLSPEIMGGPPRKTGSFEGPVLPTKIVAPAKNVLRAGRGQRREMNGALFYKMSMR